MTLKESQVAMMKEDAVTSRKSKITCLNAKLFLTNTYIPGSSHLLELLDDDTKPHDVLEKIKDDTFILSCIEAINEHGTNDPNLVKTIGEIYLKRHLFCA